MHVSLWQCYYLPAAGVFLHSLRSLRTGSAGLVSLTCGQTQARAAPDGRRIARIAGRRTAEPGPVVPAAAAKHAGRACILPPNRIPHRVTAISPPRIAAPLPHIPMHIVQTPAIRFLLLHSLH